MRSGRIKVSKLFLNFFIVSCCMMHAYITAVIRCAPPHNKPMAKEVRNCSEYLLEEVRLLNKVEILLTLGRIAFDTYRKYIFPKNGDVKPRFHHERFYELTGIPTLVTSYHPSRQNTQTGKLSWGMWINVFKKISQILA